MITKELALKWLDKQRRSKEMGLYRAQHKVNASYAEIKNLEDAIEIIDYLREIVEESHAKGDASD